jgi:uncharacterized protein (DUF2141 family)
MFKKLLFLCALFAAAGSAFADNNITLEINGVTVQGGSVYVAVYSNENDYKAENPFIRFILEPVNSTLTRNLELPNGEYVVTIFQDVNSNGVLDTNFLGIPREPVGITNYNGRGISGGFHKLKVSVNNNSARITVNMGNVRL